MSHSVTGMSQSGDCKGAVDFYVNATNYLRANGYAHETDWCEALEPLERQTPAAFLWEYVWVVLNAGMREQVARKIFERVSASHDPGVIGHPGKRSAIRRAFQEYEDWFAALLVADDKLVYLESLPWIGPATKFHLARNCGIDCVKPDRHLVRLADRFGYPSPGALCRAIQSEIGGRIGAIDVVLWRYCNLTGVSRETV